METAVDGFWHIVVLAKCSDASSSIQKLLWIASCLILVWLATELCYWSHPGGPAWGKRRSRCTASRKGVAAISGPRGLPLIGSMHLMAGLAHRRLAAAAERFDAKRLMAFSLGETRAIISSHPDVAREILGSADFADRPTKESAYSLMFNRAIGFAPYGLYWRALRRIAATHLFCPKQISRSEPQRFEIAAQMADYLRSRSNGVGAVRVREMLRCASLNSIMSSVFGKRYELKSADAEAEELRRLVEEGYDLLGKLNWSDHIPFLSVFDLQKIRFRCSDLVPKVNHFVRRIVAEHRSQTQNQERNTDFVDVLLSLQNSENLSDSDIIAVLWEMVFRGTDTVAVLIEWILARLILHSGVQSKVHEELDRVVGRSRPVTESDMPALQYLHAVVKEVLRLHPPGPLLSWARLAINDTTVDGRHVPAGTTAMVNMWAISRDPGVWARPTEFAPERFCSGEGGMEFSLMGSDLRLAPFGSGRRVCPGKTLGLTTVSFWAASLLHEFAWRPVAPQSVSLSEELKLSCEMKFPLTAKARPRRFP